MQIDGEKMETVTDFTFLDSEITADGDCSHKIKRHFILGRKAMTKPESILKSRDINLSTKFLLVEAMILGTALVRLHPKFQSKAYVHRSYISIG